MIRPAALLALLGVAAGAAAVVPGRLQGVPELRAAAADPTDPAYDGSYAFVRLRYGPATGGLAGNAWFRRRGDEMWNHDSPRAETNFLRIIQELTSVRTTPDHRLILSADDPELFRHPIAYIVEVGFWSPTDAEVEALRSWLRKGGFLIVDDFRGGHWDNFEAQMQRVLPGARFQPLDGTAEIFDTFFHIPDPYSLAPPYDQQLVPVYLGVFEENDPERRLMVIANYNQDHAEYWEFSDYGYYPIDLSNEAYKFGVNYIVYGLTH